MTNRQWLLETADVPIQTNLIKNYDNDGRLLRNKEAAEWFSRLEERSLADNIGAIHGSHDYRMENILGKCWILGLSKNTEQFAEKMEFIIRFLNSHINTPPPDELSFGKIYHFRDFEKVLCCFLPLLGFYGEPAVMHIVRTRIDILYNFAKQKRYDIYIDGSTLKGVKKEWQPYIIDPELYSDGHIALPDMHDFLMFAGMYPFLSDDEKNKVETIAEWLFDKDYDKIIRRYGYFYVKGGSYSAKAVIFKLHLLDFHSSAFNKCDIAPLVFTVFVLSHFKSARKSEWFAQALKYLEQYKNENGRYKFPINMITEKPDSYVIFGGHMNVGENKRSKAYSEIVSTYWMERIHMNTISSE
ncbi:MAG: hypothetical protein K2H23_07555 [Oscillospiraceae bacterium]|nr:hypothetical protein [Oscillospiraceae bacterium]